MLGWWGPPPTSTQWMSSRPQLVPQQLAPPAPGGRRRPACRSHPGRRAGGACPCARPGRAGRRSGAQVRARADDVDVARRHAAPLDRDPPVALVGGDHEVGRLERLALEEPQPGQGQPAARSRTWPGTSRARGRGGRTGTACRTASRSGRAASRSPAGCRRGARRSHARSTATRTDFMAVRTKHQRNSATKPIAPWASIGSAYR